MLTPTGFGHRSSSSKRGVRARSWSAQSLHVATASRAICWSREYTSSTRSSAIKGPQVVGIKPSGFSQRTHKSLSTDTQGPIQTDLDLLNAIKSEKTQYWLMPPKMLYL